MSRILYGLMIYTLCNFFQFFFGKYLGIFDSEEVPKFDNSHAKSCVVFITISKLRQHSVQYVKIWEYIQFVTLQFVTLQFVTYNS